MLAGVQASPWSFLKRPLLVFAALGVTLGKWSLRKSAGLAPERAIRQVGGMMPELGSYSRHRFPPKTSAHWRRKFGAYFARRLRRRLPSGRHAATSMRCLSGLGKCRALISEPSTSVGLCRNPRDNDVSRGDRIVSPAIETEREETKCIST